MSITQEDSPTNKNMKVQEISMAHGRVQTIT